MRNDGGTGSGRCLSSFVDEGSTESHRYYLARRTLLEMLRDRGYEIPNSEIELTLHQFHNLHGQAVDVDQLSISESHTSDPDNKNVLACSFNLLSPAIVMVAACFVSVIAIPATSELSKHEIRSYEAQRKLGTIPLQM